MFCVKEYTKSLLEPGVSSFLLANFYGFVCLKDSGSIPMSIALNKILSMEYCRRPSGYRDKISV